MDEPPASTDKESDPGSQEQPKLTPGVFPVATRHLLLIRHGQYNLNGTSDNERHLTELGRQQAQQAAERLKQLDLPYSKIIQSTMTRATETAQIISKALPDIPVSSCDLLREGIPALPSPLNRTMSRSITEVAKKVRPYF